MKIGLVITFCNEIEYTKNCVKSIVTNSPFELILIDDFSIDETKDWMRNIDNNVMGALGVHKIIDPDTDSLGAKWNLGMEKAKELGCEAALVCNNDILFSPFTIDNLVNRLELARSLQENIVLVSAHNRRGDITPPESILTLAAPTLASESEGPDFSCFLQDIVAWEKLGKFPTVFKPCYFEDNYWHTLILAHGLKAIATTAAPYYHYGSITQNSVVGGLCKPPQFERNRAIFAEIFGAEPDKIDLTYIRKKLNITL